ncbi:MAG: hypothetical protein ACE5J9_10505 [Methanosarcinales archaeon]
MSKSSNRVRESLEPLFRKLPAVKRPEGHVHFKKKLEWTFGILILYFALSNIPLLGMSPESIDFFAGYPYYGLFYARAGSLIWVGIEPIVIVSIVLQLLVGTKVLKLDLRNTKDQAFYQGLQKFLVFMMIAFEALLIIGAIIPDPSLANALGVSLNTIVLILFLQIFIGGVLVLFMDEIVFKWGIGSGVGLFIVANVSQIIITSLFNWKIENGIPVGFIPTWIFFFSHVESLLNSGLMYILVQGF